MASVPPADLLAYLSSGRTTASYWHGDPAKKLLGHRTTSELPATADVVIVGSGITGTFAARELVAGGRSVLMLEAREACWGATGRNGGHCHPGVWTSSPEVARFELATFHFIKNLIDEHKIPCDWHTVGAIHPIFSDDILDAAKKRIETLQKHPDLKDKAILIQDEAELAVRRAPSAIGVVFHPHAAKLHPYKLVTWLLERLLDENDARSGKEKGDRALRFNLQTQTPVSKLHRPQHGSSWLVDTPRGQIAARHVLLATNAHTPYLLPGMDGLIVPMRSQVCALEPPTGTASLRHSYGWFMDAEDKQLTHNFLIQRGPECNPLVQERTGAPITAAPDTDTTFIFGVDLTGPNGDEGKWNDDELNPIMSRMLRERLPRTLSLVNSKEPGRADVQSQELRATHEWTGIMGYSRDGNPWIGRVPVSLLGDHEGSDVSGLWLCAAYTGHGMPVAARCAIAVAEMILGKKDGCVQLPQHWAVTEDRVERVKGMEMPTTVKDMAEMLAAIE